MCVGTAILTEELHRILVVLRIEDVFVGCLVDAHLGVFVECRFGIEGFHLAGAALHEEPDDTLGLGSEVRKAVRGRPQFAGAGCSHSVPMKHGAEGHSSDPHAQIGEEGRSIDVEASRTPQSRFPFHHLSPELRILHRIVTSSFRLNKTCTRLSRALNHGFTEGGTSPGMAASNRVSFRGSVKRLACR